MGGFWTPNRPWQTGVELLTFLGLFRAFLGSQARSQKDNSHRIFHKNKSITPINVYLLNGSTAGRDIELATQLVAEVVPILTAA